MKNFIHLLVVVSAIYFVKHTGLHFWSVVTVLVVIAIPLGIATYRKHLKKIEERKLEIDQSFNNLIKDLSRPLPKLEIEMILENYCDHAYYILKFFNKEQYNLCQQNGKLAKYQRVLEKNAPKIGPYGGLAILFEGKENTIYKEKNGKIYEETYRLDKSFDEILIKERLLTKEEEKALKESDYTIYC